MIVELGKASIETKGTIPGAVMNDGPFKPFRNFRIDSF